MIEIKLTPKKAIEFWFTLNHIVEKGKVKNIKEVEELETTIRNQLCSQLEPQILSELFTETNKDF